MSIGTLSVRFLEVSLVIVGGVFLVIDDSLTTLLIWDVIALVYVIIRMVRLRIARRAAEPVNYVLDAVGARIGTWTTVFASMVGLTAALTIITSSSKDVAAILAVPCGVLAWAILHFGYADRYAVAYHRSLPDRILEFPGAEPTNAIDFAYFAFTVGVSFAVSDVNTFGRDIRARVMYHSIASFI